MKREADHEPDKDQSRSVQINRKIDERKASPHTTHRKESKTRQDPKPDQNITEYPDYPRIPRTSEHGQNLPEQNSLITSEFLEYQRVPRTSQKTLEYINWKIE